jgi:hypothetical protein
VPKISTEHTRGRLSAAPEARRAITEFNASIVESFAPLLAAALAEREDASQ